MQRYAPQTTPIEANQRHQFCTLPTVKRTYLDLEQVLSGSLSHPEDGTDPAVLELEDILHVDTVLLQLVNRLDH